jgi:hypothetical protein
MLRTLQVCGRLFPNLAVQKKRCHQHAKLACVQTSELLREQSRMTPQQVRSQRDKRCKFDSEQCTPWVLLDGEARNRGAAI